MAFFQILHWQDIPSQIKAWDEFDEVRIELPERFAQRIDRAAQRQGLTAGDDYLAQWRWGEEQEREGAAAAVADTVRRELLATWP